VKAIAEAHKKTCPQIVLRWAVQQGLSVIPKTSKVERLKENLDVTGWSLTKEEMESIDGLNMNKRYCEPALFLGEEEALDIAWF
jgi:D-xylose reductase